jgi:SWI/SNF-related matrix-associated actin-dependent regulator of chromatin subfamily A member 5
MRDSKEVSKDAAQEPGDPLASASAPTSASASAGASSAASNALVPASSSSSGGSSSTPAPVADSDWRKLMNLLLQLRKVCNHTYLFPDIAPDPYKVQTTLTYTYIYIYILILLLIPIFIYIYHPYKVNEEIVGGSGKLMMLDRMLPKLRTNGHRVLIFSQFTSMLDLLEDYCELRVRVYMY